MSTTIEDFMKTATGQQKDLLFKLSEIAEKERYCVGKINTIYNSTKSGVYSPDGVGITICEDDDDARVISMKPRQELKEIKEQIKMYMEKAVELGMKNLDFIQRNYETYVGEPLPPE